MEKANPPAQRYHFLMLLVMVGFFYLMGLITANDAEINQPVGTGNFLNNTQYFLMAFGALVLLIGGYVLAKKNFGISPSAPFIVGGALFLVCALVPVILQIVEGNYGTMEMIRHLSYPFLMVGGIIFALSIFPKTTNGTYLYSLISIGLIITAIYGCVYSYINETEMYIRIFEGRFPQSGYDVPQSFTNNRNVFAWVLLIGQIGACYLETRKSNFLNWFLALFFFVNQFFVISKSGLVLSSLLLAFFFVYRFVVGVRSKMMKTLCMLAGGLILFGIVMIILELAIGEYFNQFLRYIGYILSLMRTSSSNSLLARLHSFEQALALAQASPLKMIFGYGYFGYKEVLFATYGVGTPMDISWGINLIANGIVGVAISAIIWLFVLVTIFRAMKARMRGSFFIFFIYFLFLARSVVESADFVMLDLFGIILYGIVYFPCASYIEKRKQELEKEAYDPIFATIPKVEWKPTLGKVFTVVAPVCCLLLAFSEVILARTSGGDKIYLIVSMSIAYVFAPLLIYGGFYGIRKGKEISGIIGIVIAIFYLLSAIVLPIFIPQAVSIILPLVMLLFGLLIFVYDADKGLFLGIWKTYIRYILEYVIVGGGFYLLLRFHSGVHTPYCLGFVIIDICIVHFVLDTCIFSVNDRFIAKGELIIEKVLRWFEVTELTSIFLSHSQKEKRYAEMDIYNV